ncbi:glycoside hydrolase, partial [Phaeosphaeriaceae sp. PMI808]
LVIFLFITVVLGQSGIQLDVKSEDSIKSAAKALASGIIAAYKMSLEKINMLGLLNDFYIPQSAIFWDALLGYSFLTGDEQHDETISQALQYYTREYNDYLPTNQTRLYILTNEVQSSWGLAALSAAEFGFPKPKNAEWVDYAVNVWNSQANRFDREAANGTCGGGLVLHVVPDEGRPYYKESLPNGNLFLLSARLARFTGNQTYTQYANKIFEWSKTVRLLASDFQVSMSVGENCSLPTNYMPSAAHGIYTEGAAIMYNITRAKNWTDAVIGLVKSSALFHTSDNIIIEPYCEKSAKCRGRQLSWKGIFALTFARAALAAPTVADSISKLLSTTAQVAADACTRDADPKCSFRWAEANVIQQPGSAKDGYFAEVYNALQVV